MCEPTGRLRRFVEALSLDSKGTIRLSERPIGQAGPELTASLRAAVYQHVYMQPYPPPPDLAKPDADMTAELEQANATRPRVESGWSLLEHAPDGGVIAVRHGRSRRLMAGQFMVADGVLPARSGASLTVQLPAGSRSQQPGFLYCFGENFVDANDLSPMVRLYFNVGANDAAAFVKALTVALNRYQIPFQFKITVRGADFVRTDNAVLYLAQDHFCAAVLAIRAGIAEIDSLLADDVPLFAKRLSGGVGLAEDPGHGDSFGTSRSRLVAAALISARDDDRFVWSTFERAFADIVAAAKLDLAALHLNPGSPDIYEVWS